MTKSQLPHPLDSEVWQQHLSEILALHHECGERDLVTMTIKVKWGLFQWLQGKYQHG